MEWCMWIGIWFADDRGDHFLGVQILTTYIAIAY